MTGIYCPSVSPPLVVSRKPTASTMSFVVTYRHGKHGATNKQGVWHKSMGQTRCTACDQLTMKRLKKAPASSRDKNLLIAETSTNMSIHEDSRKINLIQEK